MCALEDLSGPLHTKIGKGLVINYGEGGFKTG